jgi:hypothetical protein
MLREDGTRGAVFDNAPVKADAAPLFNKLAN